MCRVRRKKFIAQAGSQPIFPGPCARIAFNGHFHSTRMAKMISVVPTWAKLAYVARCKGTLYFRVLVHPIRRSVVASDADHKGPYRR